MPVTSKRMLRRLERARRQEIKFRQRLAANRIWLNDAVNQIRQHKLSPEAVQRKHADMLLTILWWANASYNYSALKHRTMAAEWECIPALCSYTHIPEEIAYMFDNFRCDLLQRFMEIMTDATMTCKKQYSLAINMVVNEIRRIEQDVEHFIQTYDDGPSDDTDRTRPSEGELWHFHPDHFDPPTEWVPDEPDRALLPSENDNDG